MYGLGIAFNDHNECVLIDPQGFSGFLSWLRDMLARRSTRGKLREVARLGSMTSRTFCRRFALLRQASSSRSMYAGG